jgi:hypothetical protein
MMEAPMQKLVTGIVTAAALTFAASAAIACDLHEARTASVEQIPDVVAMSTHDGTPPVIIQDEPLADTAPTGECAEGDKECSTPSE